MPDIKLHSNPSAFNVYCNVRHCVLDWQQREASLALASRSSVQSGDSDSEEEEEFREPAVKLPKVRAGNAFGCLKWQYQCMKERAGLCSLPWGWSKPEECIQDATSKSQQYLKLLEDIKSRVSSGI